MTTDLREAWDRGDDWTGVTSAQERRKRQNRLHQRAHRKKRHLKAFQTANEDTAKSSAETTDVAHLNPLSLQLAGAQGPRSTWPVSKLDHPPIFLQVIECMGRSQQVLDFFQRAYLHWSLNTPIPRELPTLSRLNAFSALIRNASILQIPVECLETDDCSSPFALHESMRHSEPLEFPVHLCPTALQRTVAHHAWLDLFPFPDLRNNILQGIEAGKYSEDQLCDELCCDLMNLDAKSTAPVMIWGDSWDARGWEFSADFFEKWSLLLGGCSEILQATNHWREKRGAMKIDFILDS
ncbi:hypothetical protein BKA56DRAFT_574970 [Ilyonectria sp. MPI-CAGE-AT-0026]|nr:hypothetical protein BKA56DRAFT_574970 [Ilyonectria sp. MPI-CAGE-AT-0026]